MPGVSQGEAQRRPRPQESLLSDSRASRLSNPGRSGALPCHLAETLEHDAKYEAVPRFGEELRISLLHEPPRQLERGRERPEAEGVKGKAHQVC